MSTFEKLTADDLTLDSDRYDGYDDFLAAIQTLVDEDMDKATEVETIFGKIRYGHHDDTVLEFTADQERAFKDFPFGCSR